MASLEVPAEDGTGIATDTQLGTSSKIESSENTSRPIELTSLNAPYDIQSPSTSSNPSAPADSERSKENQRPIIESSTIPSNTTASPPSTSSPTDPKSPMSPMPPSLTREQTGPPIGPATDDPSPMPNSVAVAGPQLNITLLLHTGARHPYKIDEKYLKKRSVSVADNNPVNLSVYTLKELIWRDWREEWEPRPSSPSSIRLIHYGKMLDDKAHLRDGRFVPGDAPHVVHMTIKPQEVVDDEDARIAKGGGRDRDGNERSPGCRCVIQ